MTERVTIDIWSDVMCPWCVVGYKNLEQALKTLDGKIEAEIRWLPFELNPALPPEGEDRTEHIARKYGRTPEQAADAGRDMADKAEAAGFSFEYAGEGEPPPAMMWNTFDAHKLLRWTLAEHGSEAQTRLKLALFSAHFQHRRRIGDREVLLEIAQEQGLDGKAAAAALEDEALAQTVRQEEQLAWDHSISGVPAMVVDGKFLIPGAQEPETYTTALRRVVAKR
jgi:predicted DsbA family dithiol-disulfide isomerase